MVCIEMIPGFALLGSPRSDDSRSEGIGEARVGYTLDEIPNEITGKTVSCFEPALDYVAVKVPRFELEKFPAAHETLGTQMKSVGESLALGRTFSEALNKAIRSAEIGRDGLCELANVNGEQLEKLLSTLHPLKIFAAFTALKTGRPRGGAECARRSLRSVVPPLYGGQGRARGAAFA